MSAPYLGDFAEDATVHFMWSSNDSDGASITRATDGTISVYKDNGVSQSTAGVTDTEDFDSLTGVHAVTIDLSADAFYAINANYTVVLSAATIDGQTVNTPIAHFSIENRTAFPKADYPTNFASLGIESDGDLTKVNTLDGHTAQTGDSFARIGANGASLSAVPWNANWDAEVQSEVNDALVAFFTSAANLVDLIWDEDVDSSHQTAGTAGKKLDDAGAAGDPWSTALPGAYGAGTAGKIVGDNINAPIATVDTVVDAIKAVTDNLPNSGALTDLATAAALATVDTVVDAVKAVTDNLPDSGALTTIGTDTARLTAARAGALTDLIDGGRLDLLIDQIITDISNLNNVSAADVNAQMLDVLNTDTFAEPAQGAPAATATLVTKIGFLYKFLRNKITQTSTTLSVFDDAGSTVDHKATVSDDGTTYTRGEIGTGP